MRIGWKFCGRGSRWSIVALLAPVSWALSASWSLSADRHVDFVSQVQPLLAERCLICHGQDTAEGGLRLDQAASALGVLDSGQTAVVPGNADGSELMRRVTSTDEDRRMPPEGEPLTPDQVSLLRQWIDQGAEWQGHWAYEPLDDRFVQAAPATARHPVDRYVQIKLRQQSPPITPSKLAARHTLIRRLSLDLIGLPPTAAQVEQFVADRRPGAYARLVDRLLSSPSFGERWGRHWLDKARYADSDGYEKDRPRPDAWRYRDWVIQAINRDLPFDQFTLQQLAGDLLPQATPEHQLATAFHRQTLTNTEGGVNKEQWRVAAVMDRTETLGTVWLGLTVGCARCHSHKYDAITQREYYQLFAFFDNADEVNVDVVHSRPAQLNLPAQLRVYEDRLEQLAARSQRLNDEVAHNRNAWEARVAARDSTSGDAAAIVQAARIEPEARNEQQRQLLTKAYEKAVKEAQDAQKALEEHQQRRPSDQINVRVVAQRTESPRTTHLLRRGNFDQPMDPVQPGVIQALGPQASVTDRLELAQWLVAADNPLVPRVVANHVWQNLFGAGLVRTVNDFGVRGERPTHPRLLDHLALQYRRFGWSRKQLIRYIVLSHTYRQSSRHRPELADVDPNNRWLYRQNRFRVEAEIVRDVSLSVAGLLSNHIGGPSVFPPMPPDVAEISYANNFKWNTSRGADRYRRGMYTFFKRTAPHPTLVTFDCPDANTTNVRRNRSNTPLAALVLLNNAVYTEAATGLADVVLSGEHVTDDQRIQHAMWRCVSRPATADELEAVATVLARARKHFAEHPDDAQAMVGEVDSVERAAWSVAMRILLNLDEFITRE